MKILHAFADCGVEAEALAPYGEVTRATLNPRPNDVTDHLVRADLSEPDALPFDEGEFDFALLHPPCTKWSDMPSTDVEAAPDLIDEAREIGERYATHYVVENKPRAPLNNPLILDGRMFGLPIKYERAFETSFSIDQPARQRLLGTAETSPFFYSERSPEWWAAVKGVRGDYPKEHVAKNALPLAYVDYLVRGWLDATERAQGVADYSDYDERMEAARRREANEQLPITDGGADIDRETEGGDSQ